MMKIIPQELLKQFDERLSAKGIPPNHHLFYRKWLRYYLDFCDKYKNDSRNPDSLPYFINKLREKNQPEPIQKQAYHSVLVYFELYGIRPGWLKHQPAVPSVRERTASYASGNKNFHESWKPVYEKLGNEIKVRHYSPKTYKAYSNWVLKFQKYLKNKQPDVLGKEFGKVEGVLTIHDGKGKKDRIVPLPVKIIPEIDRQIEVVRKIHRQDLQEGTAGVFMFESIEILPYC